MVNKQPFKKVMINWRKCWWMF